MRLIRITIPTLALVLALVAAPEASACPGCKEAVANQEGVDAAGMRDGYYWSIIMMIAIPFTMLTAGALSVARAVRRGALPEM